MCSQDKYGTVCVANLPQPGKKKYYKSLKVVSEKESSLGREGESYHLLSKLSQGHMGELVNVHKNS